MLLKDTSYIPPWLIGPKLNNASINPGIPRCKHLSFCSDIFSYSFCFIQHLISIFIFYIIYHISFGSHICFSWSFRELCLPRQEEISVKLPAANFGVTSKCRWCHNMWADSLFSIRITQKRRQKATLRKLLQKDPSQLSPFQANLQELIQKRRDNIVVSSLKICVYNIEVWSRLLYTH